MLGREEPGILERTDSVGGWAWKHNYEKEKKGIEESDEVRYGIGSCEQTLCSTFVRRYQHIIEKKRTTYNRTEVSHPADDP